MRKIFTIITVIVLLFSCNQNKKESNTIDIKEISQEEIEQEVWEAIEGRFASWKDNDFETYMSYHHPQWKKWSSGKNHLSNKEEMANFWEIMKSEEDCLEMEITPIAIEILDDGKSAIAHYTHTETFTYNGEDFKMERFYAQKRWEMACYWRAPRHEYA